MPPLQHTQLAQNAHTAKVQKSYPMFPESIITGVHRTSLYYVCNCL